MPRPRTPAGKAKLTGAAAHDPQRFRGRSEPTTSGKPIGTPPSYMSSNAKKVWKEAAEEMAWLVREDRFALENMANAVGQMRDVISSGQPVTAAVMSAVNTAVGKLGASPTDRSKVFQPKEDDADDEFGQFLQ